MSHLILEYQEDVVLNIKNGYVGNLPGEQVWTVSSAMMFCLTIFTTIGNGQCETKSKDFYPEITFKDMVI